MAADVSTAPIPDKARSQYDSSDLGIPHKLAQGKISFPISKTWPARN